LFVERDLNGHVGKNGTGYKVHGGSSVYALTNKMENIILKFYNFI